MSWKIDALALGALGVGAYFVFVNRDKIMAWLGSQVFGPVGENIATGVMAGPSAIMGGLTGNQEQLSQGLIDLGTTPFGKAILPPGSYPFVAAAGAILRGATPKKAVAELPTSVVVGGLGYSGTPEFLAKKILPQAAGAATTDPYLKMLATVPKTVKSTPTSAPSQNLTAAQKYAKTFAMPGSPAWIAAGL